VAQEDLLLVCANIYESNFYEEVQVLCYEIRVYVLCFRPLLSTCIGHVPVQFL